MRETQGARLWARHRSTTLTSISRMSDTPTIGEKAVQLIRWGSAGCLRTRKL
jgi:hypothetical protein